jgi:predicted Rossmann-fold nucleotide-binding protein
MRTPVIGVMGGANVPEDDQETARRLGRLIAQRGWILLNGGRDAGVMAASARGAREAGGMVIGIACLGATGTLSEIALALKNQKHVVCLGWSRLPGAKNLLRSIAPSPLVHFADTPEEAIRITQEMLSKGSA